MVKYIRFEIKIEDLLKLKESNTEAYELIMSCSVADDSCLDSDVKIGSTPCFVAPKTSHCEGDRYVLDPLEDVDNFGKGEYGDEVVFDGEKFVSNKIKNQLNDSFSLITESSALKVLRDSSDEVKFKDHCNDRIKEISVELGLEIENLKDDKK